MAVFGDEVSGFLGGWFRFNYFWPQQNLISPLIAVCIPDRRTLVKSSRTDE